MKIKQKVSTTTLLTAAVVLGLAALSWFIWQNNSTKPIDSFEACVKAGNSIMTTYPETCMANGKTFTKQY